MPKPNTKKLRREKVGRKRKGGLEKEGRPLPLLPQVINANRRPSQKVFRSTKREGENDKGGKNEPADADRPTQGKGGEKTETGEETKHRELGEEEGLESFPIFVVKGKEKELINSTNGEV